jgi:hypothetical protein
LVYDAAMVESTVLWYTAGLNVLAIIAAPITALWVQRRGDDRRALKQRREQIFRTLWVNRMRPFYLVRIDSLNMIDVEFFGEIKVLDAWADLFAHYCSTHPEQTDAQMAKTREEKYATLLFEISQVLGYKFGRTHVRDNIYRPILHGQIDEIEIETRRRLLNLLKSDSLPVRFVQSTESNTVTPTAPH